MCLQFLASEIKHTLVSNLSQDKPKCQKVSKHRFVRQKLGDFDLNRTEVVLKLQDCRFFDFEKPPNFKQNLM